MQVRISIIRQDGHCSCGHKPGDTWIVDNVTPTGICFSAFCSLLPWVQMLRFDGKPAWDVDVACPDPDNPVVFRVEKVESA